jgi:hypothetical protein
MTGHKIRLWGSGSFVFEKDESGRTRMRPKGKRAKSVSDRIRERKSKRVTVVRGVIR